MEHLVEDVVNWLNNPTVSETSKVGILSSPQFLNLTQPFLENDTSTQFHHMLCAISLAYTQTTAPDSYHLTIPELYQIGSLAGHTFLKILDKLLKPQHLRNCSGDQLRAYFLLIFGTILAAGYTQPMAQGNATEDIARFKDTQDFLCQILAHYLVYLGSQLKLQLASGADRYILQAAPVRWLAKGMFQWRTAHGMESGPQSTPDAGQNLALEENHEFALLETASLGDMACQRGNCQVKDDVKQFFHHRTCSCCNGTGMVGYRNTNCPRDYLTCMECTVGLVYKPARGRKMPCQSVHGFIAAQPSTTMAHTSTPSQIKARDFGLRKEESFDEARLVEWSQGADGFSQNHTENGGEQQEKVYISQKPLPFQINIR